MNRLTDRQIQTNAGGRDLWSQAASHRQHVTTLITDSAPTAADRLCVLGAGNCNDLDLPTLCDLFSELHLVDLDTDALAAAVQRQGIGQRTNVMLHGDCDVSGVWDELARWSPLEPPNDQQVGELIAAIRNAPAPRLPGPFDVVVSACLASQLINAAVLTVGEGHAKFADVVRAMRNRHLRLLIELTAPGGIGIFITDIVSSESAPQLAFVPEGRVDGYVAKLVKSGNTFHGLNPAVIRATFERDAEISSQVDAIEFIKPWLWNFGGRYYAVVAVKFRRRA